jgi:hypothetical protein
MSFFSSKAHFMQHSTRRSRVTLLKRHSHSNIPARIVCVTEDASIRIISPVTGAILLTGFPLHKDANVLDEFYHIESGKSDARRVSLHS